MFSKERHTGYVSVLEGQRGKNGRSGGKASYNQDLLYKKQSILNKIKTINMCYIQYYKIIRIITDKIKEIAKILIVTSVTLENRYSNYI